MTQLNNSQNHTANQLADRILEGAKQMAEYTSNLSAKQWNSPVLGDGRSIGVVVHHVASVYPVEVELASVLAAGNPITGATKEVIDQMNAEHSKENKNVSQVETIALLKKNSETAAEIVRGFSGDELRNSNQVSLYANAPLTCQFFIEDHALRHSFHHLAKIKESL
jgi:hypothetical protein